MNMLVLYLMVLQNIQIVLLEDLSVPSTDAPQAEYDENVTTDKRAISDLHFKGDERNNAVENEKHHSEYLSKPQPSIEETYTDVSYPFKTLLRLLKVKGGINDGLDGASKVFGSMQDVGDELFGMVKDGALNVGKYFPFK